MARNDTDLADAFTLKDVATGSEPSVSDTTAERRGVILVVDDHELIRKSIAQALLGEFAGSRVIEAGHFDEALRHIDDPDVYLAICDLRLPGMSSTRDLAKLRFKRPEIHIIVLSGSESRTDILAALDAGAHGYIVKRERTEVILERIKHILAGEIYVPPCVAILTEEAPLPGFAEPSEPSPEVLTPRQREVLQLITEGLSNKAIGRQLGVAEGTVKMHVATILKAIGANNRAHAAAIGKKFL
jgi:DNA-binding NarL/FixJ family response regulator